MIHLAKILLLHPSLITFCAMFADLSPMPFKSSAAGVDQSAFQHGRFEQRKIFDQDNPQPGLLQLKTLVRSENLAWEVVG